MTLPPADTPAAPGVTKEVRAAIDAVCDAARDDFDPKPLTDARTALLAAIEKFGKQQRAAGRDDERAEYHEPEYEPYD